MSTPAIQILNSDGHTSFSPSSQTALVSDLVFWQNKDSKAHLPWPTDSNYKPEATGWFPAVPPGETSGDFATPTSPQTVYYYCHLHPKETTERGTINVVNSLP
jgi:plastocyanin